MLVVTVISVRCSYSQEEAAMQQEQVYAYQKTLALLLIPDQGSDSPALLEKHLYDALAHASSCT